MTRINPVPVEWLADQHLLAEYREAPRVFSLARPLKPREVPIFDQPSSDYRWRILVPVERWAECGERNPAGSRLHPAPLPDGKVGRLNLEADNGPGRTG